MSTSHKKKISFERIAFTNRWKYNYPPDDWTIIGIAQRWFSPESFEYKICLFGFDLHIWFKREFYAEHRYKR